MVTADGRRVRHGRLYRTASPVGSPEEVEDGLAAAGVSRVVDLRTAQEIARRPSPVAGSERYAWHSMIDARKDHLREADREVHLVDTYRGSVDRNASAIVEAITAIAEAPPGAVLVHCVAGKDRTGIVIALVLRLLGVPEGVVVDDYARSEAGLTATFAAELEAIPDEAERARWQSRQHSRPDTMRDLLRHLDDRHGGVAAYLEAAGLEQRTLDQLSGRLLEESPDPAGVPAVPTLEVAGPDRRAVVERLWQLYRHDLGEFRDAPPASDGSYPVHELPTYFAGDPDRRAYLLRSGAALGGFALVSGVTDGPRLLYAFFVVRALRRKGLGHAAALELLDRHPGAWEIGFQEENPGAARFWRQVARDAAAASWHEERRPVPDKPWLPPDTILLLETG